MIVSDESLCFIVPLIVRALFVEMTLASFRCVFTGAAFGLAFTVPESFRFALVGVVGAEVLPFPLGGTGGGTLTVDLREAALLVAVEAEETDERTEDVESVLFGVAGDNFLVSVDGEGGGRRPLVDAAVETLDAADETLTRGELTDTAVVLVLVVEVVDTTRERATELRAAELGVMSDLAVSKFVDPSLVVDNVESGRDKPEEGRKDDGPATVFRIVDA